MKLFNVLAILSLLTFANCATTKLTPEQKIAEVGLSYQESEKQLTQAEKDLALFEKSLARLRETAADSRNMRTKSAYDETLARLEGRLKQTRSDLQFLKETNQRGLLEYRRQLEEAAAKIQRSSDLNQSN